MNKLLGICLAVLGIGAVLCVADVRRSGLTVTTSTNANVTATADVYGTLRRAVLTVTGGTTTVSVADSDGTALFSTNNLTGSYTWTGTAYTARPVVTTTNSVWTTNVTPCRVSIIFTEER